MATDTREGRMEGRAGRACSACAADTMRPLTSECSFSDLRSVCVHFFGEPRQAGTSHAVFKTPWPGDPRVNTQRSKGGKASRTRFTKY
jgi:hypothetical protein